MKVKDLKNNNVVHVYAYKNKIEDFLLVTLETGEALLINLMGGNYLTIENLKRLNLHKFRKLNLIFKDLKILKITYMEGTVVYLTFNKIILKYYEQIEELERNAFYYKTEIHLLSDDKDEIFEDDLKESEDMTLEKLSKIPNQLIPKFQQFLNLFK